MRRVMKVIGVARLYAYYGWRWASRTWHCALNCHRPIDYWEYTADECVVRIVACECGRTW